MFDYKKIIKNRELRIRILNSLSFIPDEYMLRIQYYLKTGRKLHLNNPKRYTEKLQWYKLYYRDPLMQVCADKYEVRKYVKSKGLERILVKNYGVYKSIDQINWNILPQKFVIKSTNGSGGDNVLLVDDKNNFNIKNYLCILKKWLNPIKDISGGREWVYYNIQPRIIIDEYIESDEDNGGLIDYKFFCFNGKIEFVYVLNDRCFGKFVHLGIFSNDFKQLPYYRNDEKALEKTVCKPNNYNNMIEIAQILSCDFPHARIDLYNQNGKIFFGEITFFDGSGYMTFKPDKFDYILGEKFILPNPKL